ASAATYGSGIFPFAVATREFRLTEGAPDVVVANCDGLPNAAVTLATNNSAVGTADLALARYNLDGTLDTTFGLGGKINVGFNLSFTNTPGGFNNEDRGFSVALDANGKIVVAGYTQTSATDYGFAVARLNSDGTMDTTFGPNHNGKVVIAFGVNVGGVNVDVATSTTLAITPSGAILVGGQAQVNNTDLRMAVARLTSSGLLDPTFGSGSGPAGTVVLPSFGLNGATSENDGVDGIVVQPDGKIVLSGF